MTDKIARPTFMLDRIEIFAGAVTDVEAHVYARFRGGASDERAALMGRLRGPFCKHARTLAADVAFRDLGPGPTALAEAVVPDPCSWSPDLPHWYEAEVEARAVERVVAVYRGMFGIRRFATRGASFVLDSKRWVIRGAHQQSVFPSPLSDWRDARMAMLALDPNDELCEATSREGVMLLAEVSDGEGRDRVVEEMFRLARWPSVGMVMLPERSLEAVELKPKSLILAKRVIAGRSGALASWIGAVVCDMSAHAVTQFTEFSGPVIASRPAAEPLTLLDARARCDALQGELALAGNFAGYLT